MFLDLWRVGLERYDELKGLDWSSLSMDERLGSNRPCACGKTGANPTDRGKLVAERSLLTEASGVPVGLAVDGANRHDMKLVRATVESVPVDRPLPSPEHPQGMCLDKGSDFAEVRRTLDEFGFTAHIRSRGEEPQAIRWEAGFKARRRVVERTHMVGLSLPAHFGPLGQVPRELHRLSSLRLCPHHPPSRWVIRIGSKWVYPRACGGTPTCRARAPSKWVYPRACGGTVDAALTHQRTTGLSPARAGEPKSVWADDDYPEVYPRACGGTVSASRSTVRCEVYPRALRGNRQRAIDGGRWIDDGLSPRVRGNRQRAIRVATNLMIGSIPARAGKPPASSYGSGPSTMRVYPRACGGAPSGQLTTAT